jgi:hypothetical protein
MSPAELTKVRDALAATQTVNGVTSPAGAAVDVTIVEPSCATAMPAPSQSGAPQNAFDCNEQTAWMSATPFGDRAPSTFLVQLPGARAFDGVSLVGSAATPRSPWVITPSCSSRSPALPRSRSTRCGCSGQWPPCHPRQK